MSVLDEFNISIGKNYKRGPAIGEKTKKQSKKDFIIVVILISFADVGVWTGNQY